MIPGSDGTEYVPPRQGNSVPDQCMYRLASPQPPPDDLAWGGHDPSEGSIWQAFCPDSLDPAKRTTGGQNVPYYLTGSEPYFVANGATADEGPIQVDPLVLVSRATAAIALPLPAPEFGPIADEIAVKIPVWLSIAPFATIVQTANAGRYHASVTAELVETTWDMGEPIDPARPWDRAAPVTCTGAGMPFTDDADRAAPPCGYTYRWRSLPERTDGAGTWLVTVTARYRFTWQVTGPGGDIVESGTQMDADTETTATAPLTVREWRSILVGGNATG